MKLTAKMRGAIPTSDFALPGRRYPLPDINHARNALSRAAQFASPKEKKIIRDKVHSKFPSISPKAPNLMKVK